MVIAFLCAKVSKETSNVSKKTSNVSKVTFYHLAYLEDFDGKRGQRDFHRRHEDTAGGLDSLYELIIALTPS